LLEDSGGSGLNIRDKKETSRAGGCDLVGLTGFEPVTSPLSGVRSNLLSYRPSLLEEL
jgi:hypothetical protein